MWTGLPAERSHELGKIFRESVCVCGKGRRRSVRRGQSGINRERGCKGNEKNKVLTHGRVPPGRDTRGLTLKEAA